jgi:methylenetetrahydrofolate dehydrogenase (NADP+)/methenyltetrahydrofolate cyclohydrolase
LNLLPPAKDPDCLTLANFERFRGGNPLILPPVVEAIKKLLAEYRIKVAGKNVVVVGAGRLVGLPTSLWLKGEGARVLVLDKKTKNLSGLTRKADIVVSGAGRPGLIKGSMVKRGVVVIDCGTSSEQGRLVGDVETSSVIKKARFLAPCPGGIGPLAIVCLLENLIKLQSRKRPV